MEQRDHPAHFPCVGGSRQGNNPPGRGREAETIRAISRSSLNRNCLIRIGYGARPHHPHGTQSAHKSPTCEAVCETNQSTISATVTDGANQSSVLTAYLRGFSMIRRTIVRLASTSARRSIAAVHRFGAPTLECGCNRGSQHRMASGAISVAARDHPDRTAVRRPAAGILRSLAYSPAGSGCRPGSRASIPGNGQKLRR